MKKFAKLIKKLECVQAFNLIEKIKAYEAPVTYPRMWGPVDVPLPKRRARDSNKSYTYIPKSIPLNTFRLSEDFLSKLGFTKKPTFCPRCKFFYFKETICPFCKIRRYAKHPRNQRLDFLRKIQR